MAKGATPGSVERLEKLLDSGRDDALLRFALASEYLKSEDPAGAAEHARAALDFDPDYSAAWKLLGMAEALAGNTAAAKQAFTRGIEVARARGDRQAVNEMTVRLRRLEK